MEGSTNNYINISQFYQEKSIFITGGTGFIGKVLIEKLLRSCPELSNIYILIRSKKNQDVKTRLKNLLNIPLFNRLRKENISQLKKIVPITGDLTKVDLGISETDYTLLTNTVSIVFHAAATLKFDETLKLSVDINVVGTQRVLELCHRMVRLEALIAVSTAYCNCDQEIIKEIIYPSYYNPKNIIQAVNWMDDAMLQCIAPHLIGTLPNTYTFTKKLSENILLNQRGHLPVAVVRPTIVISSLEDPIPGWIDNWNATTGVIGAAGKGYFRTMMCDVNKTTDIVPVDFVINLMICVAWKTAISKPTSDRLMIYNYCSGAQNPITWGRFIEYSFNALRNYPLSDVAWYPNGTCQTSGTINNIYAFVLHIIPAYIIDAVCKFTGNKAIMMPIQKKLAKAAKCLEYFTTQEWIFIDNNVQTLNDFINDEDKVKFNFDVKQIDWTKYIQDYVLGIRQFMFKEDPSTIVVARGKLKQQLLYTRLLIVLLCGILWFTVILSDTNKSVFRFFTSWF